MNNWNMAELVWTGLALLGVAVSLFNVKESIFDLRSTWHIGNGRRSIAWSSLWRDLTRLVFQAGAVWAGVIAGQMPGEPRNPVGAVVFVGMLATWVAVGIFDARLRVWLRNH